MINETTVIDEIISDEEHEKLVTSDPISTEKSLIKDIPYIFYTNKKGDLSVRKCPYRAVTKMLAVKHPEIVMITTILSQKMRADDQNQDIRINIIVGGGAIVTLSWSQSEFIFIHIDLIADLLDKGWNVFAR